MTLSTTGRAWDSYDAYLFDIDGTLLHCSDAVHYFAFCHVLRSVCGYPADLEGVTAHGNTDTGIIRDALNRRSIAQELWRPQLSQLQAALCDFVEERSSEIKCNALPFVADALEHLTSVGAVLGVATGNLQRVGEIKLRRAGLLDYFRFAAWSDRFEHRRDVFRAGAEAASRHCGEHARLCAVGDTPADVAAARTCGLDVIAVATGIYDFNTLATLKPDLCLHNLGEVLHQRSARS